jgi:hypothetical protein
VTTVSSEASRAVEVEGVDFAVPAAATIGVRFASWREAVDHARETVVGFKYPGQHAREDSPDFHPRRFVQQGDTLIIYSRAFVQMRVVEPVQDRPGGVRHGTDRVACTWEVFRDGTVETLPERTSET